MASDWRDVPLEDVSAEITVGHVGSMAAEYVDQGVPFLRSQNVQPLRITLEEIRFISPEFHARLRKSALAPGDVVIVRTGKPGTCAVIPGTLPVANCSDLVIVRCGPALDPKFLAYYVNSVAAHHIDAHLVGAVQQHFNVASARAMRLRLPSIEEQRTIVGVLSALDDKIELNRKQNETLEAMARALFKAWFVDFEPVRAKIEGRWQRGQSLPGLPAHLYDLFPDRLVESELGEIPEGWEVRSLDSIANYLNGLALQKFPPESAVEFLPVIKIAQLRAGNTNGADKASVHIKPEYIVNDGDVLFSWSGSLEVEVWNGGRGALNQHLFKVTSDEVPKWFYFFATRHHLQNFRAIAAGKATTMGHIQRKHLTEAQIAVSPPEDIPKFDVVIAPIFDQLISNSQQSRTLARLRDTLLPELISGDMRVRDIEAFCRERGL